jgi:hypothetical protein
VLGYVDKGATKTLTMAKYRIKEMSIIDYKINGEGFVKYNKTVFQIQKLNLWFFSYEFIDYTNYSSFDEAIKALVDYIKLSKSKKKTKYHYIMDYIDTFKK